MYTNTRRTNNRPYRKGGVTRDFHFWWDTDYAAAQSSATPMVDALCGYSEQPNRLRHLQSEVEPGTPVAFIEDADGRPSTICQRCAEVWVAATGADVDTDSLQSGAPSGRGKRDQDEWTVDRPEVVDA